MGLFSKGIRLPGKLPAFDVVEAPLPKRVILPLRQYIGGPAGLTCAYYLARFGRSPTVFEAMPKLGGMLRYGIPTYRLPKEVLDWEIKGILELGVAVKTGVSMGADFTLETLRDGGFDAVFLATGAWVRRWPAGRQRGI
jgi:NADPH-dependent glutamate synthase beta subunit-like oxidoreductase